MATEHPIPQSRFERLAHLGRLAGGIANGVVSEGVRQLGRGKRPSLGDLLVTPNNTRRLSERLSEMRGAAMKVGQLLSLEGGELLPPEFSQALARLRESAHVMPLGQVAQTLRRTWGEGWDSKFNRFSFTPMAAASIGQVHRAELRDGTQLAIKIHYPGIRESIDSDVDNVATLLRLVNLIPKEIDFGPLLAEAKQQLHAETDYQQEAEYLRRFARQLEDDPRFELPIVIESHTNTEVLAMSYLDGNPIEVLDEATPAERDRASCALLELTLREVFEWGLIQTDPNFANYRYRIEGQKLQLLDFGATREYSIEWRRAFANLLIAGIEGDARDIASSAIEVGYLTEDDTPVYREGIVGLLRTAIEPARSQGMYNFGASDLASRLRNAVLQLRMRDKFSRIPPPEVLFMHRKLGGLYLLLSRLQARVPVRQTITPMLEAVSFESIG